MDAFHPIIQQWFDERYGEPTEIQATAWPRIALREHLLITAPTGSGKTLTAFLWAINQFAAGTLTTGATRVLYLSPLKALNNDIRRNLMEPLGEIRQRFEQRGEKFPDIRVMTRSGDTEQEARRRMLKHPPEILITTPESLNILLSSAGGKTLLHDIDTLIIDEVHSVVDSKRGSYLMSAVERLVPMSGEFQRIALSATVNPMATVGNFIAGYQRDGDVYSQRQVNLLSSSADKEYQITVRYPESAANRGEDEKVWGYLAEDMLPRINANQSTLIFVNSRALCEKLTYWLNKTAGQTVAYAHHGSLSRDIRNEVEQRLKAGELEAIVATSTLEMGIDIGALDEVMLVQSPGSIASTIQRIGRAGHQVGAPSRCTIYPTHPQDFVESAVLASAVIDRDLEPVHIIRKPLDVLAQVVISMTGTETWDLDQLYAELKRSETYHELSRDEFGLVINMLAGRYAAHHLRELKPRVRIDRTNNRIEAHRGSLMSLYLSGGVIPDRGYYQLRHDQGNARIGDLDEEFVWEANVGQVFSFGTQNWQVKKITHNEVFVAPAKPDNTAPPFWTSEPISRSFHYAQRINRFLEEANEAVEDDSYSKHLASIHHTDTMVAEQIVDFLKRQKQHTGGSLPHRHHLMFEAIRSGPGRAAGHQLVIHTGWGAAVNRPFAMALEGAWQAQFGEQPEVHVANESIVLQLVSETTAADLLSLVRADELEQLLRIRLEGSGFFGARFRENAGRALLISKGRFNERKPLWMSRLQSQRLMESVLKYEDFPILLETWRTCLQDEFDLDNLRLVLNEIDDQQIVISEVETASPSPFALSVAWDQVNTYMYRRDDPKSQKQSQLRNDLLQELVWSPSMRPAIRSEIIERFISQRQRLLPGHQPADLIELEEWVKERTAIPADEWRSLIEGLSFEWPARHFSLVGDNLCCAREDEAHLTKVLRIDSSAESDDLEVMLSNWLQYYGPVTAAAVSAKLGINDPLPALMSLCDAEVLIEGTMVEGSDDSYFCDALNYEFLLRQQRAASRPEVTPQPLEHLPAFSFSWQQRQQSKDPLDALFDTLELLRGLSLNPELWETEVLPARHPDYRPGDLDTLFSEGALMWLGFDQKKTGFCLPGEEDLMLKANALPSESQILPDDLARYDVSALTEKTGLDLAALNEQLWHEAWQGLVTNDSYAALRAGINSNFEVPDISSTASSRRGRRAAFGRWKTAVPSAGSWYRVRRNQDQPDAIEANEIAKEQARVLLGRYGVLFRELCDRETDSFQWRFLYRALRLMELGGEVVSGYFFEQVPGPQFMTPTAVRHFQQHLNSDSHQTEKDKPAQIFFINAMDPVSPCGLGLGIHGDDLPRRIASNYLVYDQGELALVISRRGKSLKFIKEPDEDALSRYLEVLHHLSYRNVDPVRQLRIETINHVDAASSPYREKLESVFNVYVDYKAIVVQREL